MARTKKTVAAKEKRPPCSKSEPQSQPKKKEKRAYRFRPGTVALREIRKYRKSTNMLIPFAPFVRLVRDIADNLTPLSNKKESKPTPWTPLALLSLQESAEYHLVDLFGKANLCAIHSHRVTINMLMACEWARVS
ncbi:beta centromeric histone H3 [Hordeum vulgare]|nr:beta centromeric histone H3 [Hordeum vulgare]